MSCDVLTPQATVEVLAELVFDKHSLTTAVERRVIAACTLT